MWLWSPKSMPSRPQGAYKYHVLQKKKKKHWKPFSPTERIHCVTFSEISSQEKASRNFPPFIVPPISLAPLFNPASLQKHALPVPTPVQAHELVEIVTNCVWTNWCLSASKEVLAEHSPFLLLIISRASFTCMFSMLLYGSVFWQEGQKDGLDHIIWWKGRNLECGTLRISGRNMSAQTFLDWSQNV